MTTAATNPALPSKATFTKRERLLNRAAFDAVFNGGKREADNRLVMHVRANGLGYGRLGLVVSRKYGHSPRRNRLKRLLREVFRLNKREAVGHDIVILPRGPRTPDDYEMLQASFLALLAKAKSG